MTEPFEDYVFQHTGEGKGFAARLKLWEKGFAGRLKGDSVEDLKHFFGRLMFQSPSRILSLFSQSLYDKDWNLS